MVILHWQNKMKHAALLQFLFASIFALLYCTSWAVLLLSLSLVFMSVAFERLKTFEACADWTHNPLLYMKVVQLRVGVRFFRQYRVNYIQQIGKFNILNSPLWCNLVKEWNPILECSWAFDCFFLFKENSPFLFLKSFMTKTLQNEWWQL